MVFYLVYYIGHYTIFQAPLKVNITIVATSNIKTQIVHVLKLGLEPVSYVYKIACSVFNFDIII